MSPSSATSANRKHSQSRHSIVDRCSTIRACEPCRRRKRLCNGQKPCSLCKTESIECVYSVISDHPRGVFTTNTARRLSSGSACETCRRRKTKCDGSNPCAFCAANNLKCVNNAERRKRASISVTTASSLTSPPPHHPLHQQQPSLSPSSSTTTAGTASTLATSPLQQSTSRSSSTASSTGTTHPGSDHETMDRIEDRLRRIEQLMTVFSPSPLSQSTLYPDNNSTNRRTYRNNSTAGSHFNLPPHFVRQQRHSVQGIAVAKEQLELKIARRAMSSSPPQFGHTTASTSSTSSSSSSSERLHAGAYITPPNSGGKNQQQQQHPSSPPPLSPEQSSTMVRQASNQSHPLTSSMLNLTLSPSSSTSSTSNTSSMHLLQASTSTPLSEQQQQQHAYGSFGSAPNFLPPHHQHQQQREYHPITATAVPPMPSLMALMDIDPFPLEWEDDDHHIIESLIRQHEHAPKELRCRSFQVNGEEWLSWTMLEHLYRKTPSQYPTQARGLFTRRQPNGRYTVQVRGYDKFFNVNETAKTQWSALEQDTLGPYTITAKENGCIVFIAAVSPTELVVTSKHMIPDPQDDPTSHGGVGYRWLLHHLASAHQAPATLAAWLHKFRVTMVAELCDDDFEEHVVPCTTGGLYLHGINYNTTTLHTLPIDQVQTIGHHFGFHTIHHQKVSSFATLRSFVDDAQRMHQVMNENESEGIVIRCKRDSTAAMDFFFKVKYETYLMYREYREITKALVDIQQQQQDGDNGKITVVVRRRRGNKKLKIRFDRSLYYILWLQERVVDHPEWFYDYSRNKGIIAVRQAFEEDWKEGRLEGADIGAVQDWVERVHW